MMEAHASQDVSQILEHLSTSDDQTLKFFVINHGVNGGDPRLRMCGCERSHASRSIGVSKMRARTMMASA
jgi:hypothetical protein